MQRVIDRPARASRARVPRLAAHARRGRGLPRQRGRCRHAARARPRADSVEDPDILVVDVSGEPARSATPSTSRSPRRTRRPTSSPGASSAGTSRQNAGLGTSAIRVVTGRGSLFDPAPPAALSARHLTVQRLSDVLVEALGRAPAGSGRRRRATCRSRPSCFQAVDARHGRLTLLADILGGGGGARPGAPGDSRDRPLHIELRAAPGRDRRARVPVRHRADELVDGSGGAGRQPGGLASAATTGSSPSGPTGCTTSSRPTGGSARGRRRWRPRRPGARPDPPQRRFMADREPGQGLSAPPPRWGRRLVRGRRRGRLRRRASRGTRLFKILISSSALPYVCCRWLRRCGAGSPG